MMKIILRQKLLRTRNFLNNTYRIFNGSRLLTVLGLIIICAELTMAQNLKPGISKKSDKSDSPLEAFKGKKENLSKRDLYSKHYLNENGSYTALISAGPIHYKKDNAYLDIDPTILPSNDPAYPYANTANLFEAHFGASAHQGVKNNSQEGEIKEFLNTKMYWEVNGQANNTIVSNNSTISVAGDKAYYRNLYGSIDAEFIMGNGRRKLNYIIPSVQALGNVPSNANYLVFTEDIILPQDWTYTVTSFGIEIRNTRTNSKYFYNNPTSTDNANGLEKENTIFDVSENNHVLTIKTKVRLSWLLANDRQFTVKEDPTTNYYPNGTSYNTGQTYGTGGAFGNIAVGYSGGYYRGFAAFDTSTLDDNVTVTATALYHFVSTTVSMGTARGSELRAFLAVPGQDYTTSQTIYDAITNTTISPTIYQTVTHLGTTGWKNVTLGTTANTHLKNRLPVNNFTIGYRPSGTYSGANQYALLYGTPDPGALAREPYIAVTYTVPASMVCATLTNLTASLGSPFNGLSHYLNLNWDALAGATGYDVQFSTDNMTFTNATPASVSTNSAVLNAGDYPNARYWFRVRAKDAVQTCDWTYSSPIYTAADVPPVPLLTNAVGTSLDLTLQAETPVVNPAITTYSIVCSTTGQFVQADGTLGATEVFRTKADWGTVHVTGLTAGTEYCFYAKARNGDGHVVSGGTNLSGTETFVSNANFNATSASPTNKWWTPPTPTSGSPMLYNASGSNCSDGYVGFSGSLNNFFGSFLRSPQQNCTGLNEVTMTFDLSNSYFADQPLDRIYFNMWAPTAAVPGGTYINATIVDGAATNTLYFSEVRNCKRVTVTFNLSSVTNKSAILFYLNVNCGYNKSNVFSFRLDNISILDKAPTACIAPASAPTPIFHNLGGNQQIVFDNARYNTDQPVFRVSHPGASTANNYQIEMNTKEDFTGISIVQTFTAVYPAQTPTNFVFSSAAGQLADLTTYYVRARINTGSGYGSWSTKLHSYTYDKGKTYPNWFQTTTPQFLTDQLTGTTTTNHYTTVTPASGGGAANVFTDPSFETGQNWSTKSSYAIYETYLTSNANGTNGITNGTNCLKYAEDDYSWQYFINGEYNNVSQQVDLTGVGEIKFDLTHWRNTQSTGYSCGIGRACKVVWSFKVIIGNAGTSNDNSGTEVYTWTPTTAEFGVTNKMSETIDLSAYGFTGTKTVKFARVVTNGGGSWYDDDKYYLDNIRTGAGSIQTSGTIISTPIRLASVQGATGYKELVWNQELAGGSVKFDMQRYNTVSSLWETVSGFSNIQDATSNGEKSFDLQGASFPAFDSIRIVGYLNGSAGALKLNDWAIYFTQPLTPLPVVLTSFTATCEREVKLSWSTASEQNSDVFILEKSKDLIDWIFVSDQTAAGNSSIKTNYTASDENPWNEIGYYRLRQLDFNGQQRIYGPISVSCDRNESSLTVYPNPNKGDFTIEISSTVNMRDVQLNLTDLTGKIITSRNLNIQAGTTQIFLEDLGLQMGTYFIQFHGAGNQLKPVKVVVNK